MLRSVLLSSERLYMYTCLVVPSISRLNPLIDHVSSSNVNWSGRKHLHTTPAMAVLPKDHPQKKLAVMAAKAREEISPIEEETLSNIQMKASGHEPLYPTAETHSMLINGVTYDELPIIHIKATDNNTILSITKPTGDAVAMTSAGMEGFKNAKKGTNIAAQAVGISAGQKAVAKGMMTIRVSVRGIGPGRLPAIKGLQMAGLNIVSITDVTRLQHSWQRPKKKRRL